ncbi:AraC family transcriptional regulator [Mesorhizobium loti]|nr:AraC family transcriptional regulator [Mesorhizobium loti]PLP56748.1 AraC family transcriptional regulator [Mesorhizobium loti]
MPTPVEKAIWFIESHFAGNITLDDVAKVCDLSRFQMSRLFSYATGNSVTGYLRGRRLTEAARALAAGAPDILAVAIEAGYGSHEAFSRAFREQFGLTPAELRTRGHLEGITLLEPLREDPNVTVRLPLPRVETPGPLLIAGIGRRFACDDLAGIPALWQEFAPHLDTIPGRRSTAAYGLVTGAGVDDSYFYLAGVEVRDVDDLDAGLTGIRLPAQRWAVSRQDGHITTISATIHAIFSQALPEAGLTPGDIPDLLERYGEDFDPVTGTGGFEIWIPVK